MSNALTIAELTERMHAFVRAKGWYNTDSKRPQSPRNLAASLAIEVAEVLEHYQWEGRPVDKQALSAELADVLLYLLQIASLEEVDLQHAVLAKLDANYAREWDQDN